MSPLYEKIYSNLRMDIVSGKLSPGTPLPSEQELSRQYGVSRITTSHALKMLAQQGLITRMRGKGTFVKGQSHRDVADQSPSVRLSEHVLIGYVVPDLHDSFGNELLSSMERAMADRGGFVLTARTYGDPAVEEQAIERFLKVGVRGLMVFPGYGEYYNPTILRLSLSGFPIILVDRYWPKIPIPSVTSDNRQAAYVLTNHLVQLGHKRIAFFSPHIKGTSTLEDRFEGYTAAMREGGIVPDLDWCPNVFYKSPMDRQDQTLESQCVEACREFLSAHPDITAVVTMEYDLALYTFRACRELGLHVPQDLSIATFDKPSRVPLPWTFTHIHQNERLIGQHSVDAVLRLIERGPTEDPSPTMLAVEFVPGDSSAPAPEATADRHRAGQSLGGGVPL